MQEGNPDWDEDEAVAQCCGFLQNQQPTLSTETAFFFANKALAEWKGLNCSGWHIRENSGQSIVVSHTNDEGNIKEYCLSLPELIHVIEQRKGDKTCKIPPASHRLPACE